MEDLWCPGSPPPQLHEVPTMGCMLNVFFWLLQSWGNHGSLSQHLAWGDVSVDSVTHPSVVKVHLKFSKCDQLGKGIDVFLGRSGNRICPVAACLAYMAIHGPTPGPFFCGEDGAPLTKPQFVSLVHEVLTDAGLDATLYSGHSFRLGAATSAAQAGMEDSTIKALGRWSSTAFLLYIRTPKHHLAQLTTSLLPRTHLTLTSFCGLLYAIQFLFFFFFF